MDVLHTVLGGERRTASVGDPLGRPVDAAFVLLPDGRTAVVEAAQASGLGLVAEEDRDAFAASSEGTGELIVAAAAAGADNVLVTVGGSATTDGGSGAVRALDEAGVRPRLEVLCDVNTPFEDAPRVFAPQKGADPQTVKRLGEAPAAGGRARPARSPRRADDRRRGRPVGRPVGPPRRGAAAGGRLRAERHRLRRRHAGRSLRGHGRGPPRRADDVRQGGRRGGHPLSPGRRDLPRGLRPGLPVAVRPSPARPGQRDRSGDSRGPEAGGRAWLTGPSAS